jgi:hypothetical protein
MNFKFFLYGIKNLIMDPVKAWDTIDSENKHIKVVGNSLFIPLIVLVSVSAFAGSLIYTNSEMLPVYSVFVSIKCFLLFYFTTYATAYILNEITNMLDLGRDFNISFRITVYSIVPFLLCQILSRLFESLLFVNIIGFYGLYIFWVGAEKILALPQNKKIPLLIGTTIAMVGIYIALNLVLTMLTDKIYFAFFAY